VYKTTRVYEEELHPRQTIIKDK